MQKDFNNNFLFGTATSAFQIEGGHETEWKGFIGADSTPIKNAIEHYKRIDEDLQYILYLGNAYRFSMDWSKLQTKPFAELEPLQLKHYAKIFKTLKENGKKVFLVLNHFASPLWMYNHGGWTSRDSHEWFLDYAVKVLKAFHDYIDIINTFNEPNAYANLAYLLKIFLPKRTNPILRNICFSNMKKAHIKVYDYIKRNYPHIITGISQAHMIVEPLNVKSIAANFIKKLFDFIQHEHMHEYFIHNGKYADYIGFSYYGRILIDGSGFPLLAYEKKGRKRLDELSIEHDDMWELYPQGLYNMLRFFYEKYKKPLIITENGTCTEDDNLRKSNLFKHLTYIKKACDEGLPVLGYFHWSTFDNFELAHGPTRRFGLTYIDYKTGLLNRTIKPSGHYYHDIAMSGKLLEP